MKMVSKEERYPKKVVFREKWLLTKVVSKREMVCIQVASRE